MAEVRVFRGATSTAINWVLTWLWERGVDELKAFGLTHPDAFAKFKLMSTTGESWWVEGPHGPVAVFGLSPQPDGTLSTWFQATDEFDLHYRGITKTLRSILKARSAKQIILISPMVHARAEAWFKTLGFTFLHTGTWGETGAPMRIYVYGTF